MSAIQYQPKINIEISDLLQMVQQLKLEDLQYFSQQIEKITAERIKKQQEIKEAELLKKVDLDLTGEDKRRYEELHEYLRNETLTDDQQKELLKLEKKREQLNVKRMMALVELSKIRKVNIEELIISLNLIPLTHG